MDNTVNIYQEDGEHLIEREIYKDAYEYLKASFTDCVNTKKPKMFAVVGPGGRGKTKMCRNIVSKLHKDEQFNAKYIVLDLKNIETIESEYTSLFISALIITEIYQYISNDLGKENDEKLSKLEQKAIELLKLWNIFSEIENLNKKITIKETKDGLLKGAVKMVLSFGETCATTVVAIQNPIIAAAYSVGVGKAKEIVEGFVEKIKLKDGDEKDLEARYQDFFEHIRISKKSDQKGQDDNAQHKQAARAAASNLFDSYLNFFKRVFNYYSQNPFTIVLDNSESIDFSDSIQRETSGQLKASANIDIENFEKLFKLESPVVWYVSGQKVPFKIDRYYDENSSLIKRIELLAFNFDEVKEILFQENILVDDLPLKDEEIYNLLKNTEGNPLWIKIYVNRLKKRLNDNKEYDEPLTIDEYYEIINESTSDLMVRLLGCNLANPTLTSTEKNRILYGMIPSASWDVFDKVAKKCSIDRTKSDDIMIVESGSDSYSVHGDLVSLIRKTLLDYKEKYDDIKSIIKTIIEETENLVYENKDESETNEFVQPYLSMISIYSSVEEINDKLIMLCKTKVNDKTLFDINRRNIVNIIHHNKHFVYLKYDEVLNQYVLLKSMLSKYEEEFKKDISDDAVKTNIQNMHFSIINAITQDKNNKRKEEYYIETLKINLQFLDSEISNPVIFVRNKKEEQRFADFVFNNCVALLKEIQKYNNDKYFELKQLYIDKANALEEKLRNNEYVSKVERAINKAHQSEYEIYKNSDQYIGYLENYVNKVLSYNHKNKNPELFFLNGDRMFFYLEELDVNNDKTQEIANKLFRKMFEEYKANYKNYKKKYDSFLESYTKYALKKGLTEKVEKTLLNNLVIDDYLVEEAFGCLINCYSKAVQDDKIIKLVNKVYNEYYLGTKDKEKKSYMLRMFSNYNDVHMQVLLRNKLMGENKEIIRYRNIMYEMRNANVVSNYLLGYDFINKVTTNEPNIEQINELLDMYFVFAFTKYKKNIENIIVRLIDNLPDYYKNTIEKYNIYSFIEDYQSRNLYYEKIEKIWDKEYTRQIKLENTILIALAYLLRYNNALEENTLINIIEERINQAIIAVTSNNKKVTDFMKINYNLYRKIINVTYVIDLFTILSNNLDDKQASDVLTKSLRFRELSSTKFYNEKGVYNLINEKYADEYGKESLSVDKTLVRIYKYNVIQGIDIHRIIFNNSIKRNLSSSIYYNLLTQGIQFVDGIIESKYIDKFFTYLCELSSNPLNHNLHNEEYIKNYYLGENEDNQIVCCDNENIKNLYCKMIAEMAKYLNITNVSIEILENIAKDGTNKQKVYIYRKISEIYKYIGEYQKAIDYLINAINAAVEELKNNNYKIHILELYSLLATLITER